MFAVALTLVLLQVPPPQTAAAAAPPTRGSAVVRGRVVDKESGNPLPKAVVSLRNSRDRESEQRYTDDRGRFEFTGLAAGQYELRAVAGLYRSTHIATTYPLPRNPGEIGPLLTVKDAEEKNDIEIPLPRALAISGRVIDDAGQPLAQISVSATPVRGTATTGRYSPRATDDRGMFRLHGLAPGRYSLCAEVAGGPQFDAPRQRRLRYVRSCYPAVPDAESATEITLTDTEVDGIEIRMPRRPAFVISGVVVTPAGTPPVNAMVMVTRYQGDGASGTSTRLSASGAFTLSDVVPGTYEVSARLGRNSRSYEPDTRDPQWGSVRIEVTTGDVEGLVVVMKPSVSLKGRVVYEDPPQSPAPAAMQVTATTGRVGFDRPSGGAATVAEDGTFELKDLFGPVTLNASGATPRGYVLKSVLYRGRDILSIPTEFDGDPAHEVQLMFTSRTAELSGQVFDDEGNPVTQATIVRFPVDPAHWAGLPRYAMGATTRQGSYRLSLVPAGEYFLVAVPPLALNALSLPEDYERLAAIAERITVLEHDRRTADLRLRTIPPRKKQP